MEPETYKYPFEFMLPSNIPSSFEGTFGHIRYNVKVVFDVPVWLNKKFKEQFTLINAIDLNDDPSLRVMHLRFGYFFIHFQLSLFFFNHIPCHCSNHSFSMRQNIYHHFL